MLKVLITGITGFLGSHIAEVLTSHDIQVIGLKRKSSDIWRCRGFEDQIEWVDIDDEDCWKEILKQKSPTMIVHCAWIGVEAGDRENWIEQIKNIYFLADLIEIMSFINVNKFIFVGSQAEYGNINGKVTENEIPLALNAYGSVKLACAELLKTFCLSNQTSWIWLRLFSVFGEKENENWLIPSVISKMKKDVQMDFTAGEQKYAYLYVRDFADIIYKIISTKINSGIYNISSDIVHPLKSLLLQIQTLVNPEFKLNFGALAYRNGQSMHLEGDIKKITGQIGNFEFTDFNKALKNTIEYYLSK